MPLSPLGTLSPLALGLGPGARPAAGSGEPPAPAFTSAPVEFGVEGDDYTYTPTWTGPEGTELSLEVNPMWLALVDGDLTGTHPAVTEDAEDDVTLRLTPPVGDPVDQVFKVFTLVDLADTDIEIDP